MKNIQNLLYINFEDRNKKLLRKMNQTDWIGFVGVAILLLAYFLNLRNTIAKNSSTYLILNLLGAGIACFASILLKYLPFIILEGCWTLVSAIELIKKYLNEKNKHK